MIRGVARAAVQMAAVLLSFASALVLEHYAHLHADVVVLAVVMAMTLGRSRAEPGLGGFAKRLVTLPAVAFLASEVGRLMLHHVVIGDTLFVVALVSSVWLRRFGPRVAPIARLITLPFIGILVVPVPVSAKTATSVWPVVIALIALFWVSVVVEVARLLGVEQPREPTATAAPKPAAGARRDPRWWPASSRMAAQLAVALTAAFLLGHWLYPQHWPWVVISCYLVCSGNRGRGDVLHKGIQRLIGAGIGTAVATLISGQLAPLDKTAVVLIFVVIGVGTWLRQYGYGFWAASVTAALALLNGFYGITGTHELVQRLGGLALGALLGVVASWWVLPVRSGDVFRRRVADSLAALSDYLTALRTAPETVPEVAERFEHRVALVQQLQPAHRLHRRTVHRMRSDDSHAADVIDILGDLGGSLRPVAAAVEHADTRPNPRTLGAMAKLTGSVRRRMVNAEPAEPVEVQTDDPVLAPAVNDLIRLDSAFTVALWRRYGGRV